MSIRIWVSHGRSAIESKAYPSNWFVRIIIMTTFDIEQVRELAAKFNGQLDDCESGSVHCQTLRPVFEVLRLISASNLLALCNNGQTTFSLAELCLTKSQKIYLGPNFLTSILAPKKRGRSAAKPKFVL